MELDSLTQENVNVKFDSNLVHYLLNTYVMNIIYNKTK